MGQSLCHQTPHDNDLSMDPFSSIFTPIQPFIITPQINSLIQKLKHLHQQIIDPRNNHQLNYYQSIKYGFRLLGEVKSRRPVGQCLFYFGDKNYDRDNNDNYDDNEDVVVQRRQKHNNLNNNYNELVNAKQSHNNNEHKIEKPQRSFLNTKKTPLLITTFITPHYTFSPHTLIIYQDHSYYIGQLLPKKYQVPKAAGKGLLVTKQFIYQGQFDDGYPQGYGWYRTRSLQYTGYIKKGMPSGECIQKTARGMFVGRVDEKNKIGYLITPDNKRIQIHQKVYSNQITMEHNF